MSFKKGHKPWNTGLECPQLAHRRINLSDGSWYPSIPDLCHCKKHCGTIVYDGKEYVVGHNNIGKIVSEETRKLMSENCSMKRPEVAAKFKGDLNYNFEKIFTDEEILKRSKNTKEWLKTHEHPRGMKGKKHKQESKEKMQESHKGSKNHMFGKPAPDGSGRCKHYPYKSPFQGEVKLNGTYELAMAKYYDKNNIRWYYEWFTFPLNIDGWETTYTPDFFIPEENKFIEIKGYLKPESKLKIEKFKELYPGKLEVLFRDDMHELEIVV